MRKGVEWERGIGFKGKRGEGRGWGRKGKGRERGEWCHCMISLLELYKPV